MHTCSACGRNSPENSVRCECGAALPEAKERLAVENQEVASLGARLVGQFIDAFVALGLLLIAVPLSNVHESLAYVGLAGFLGYYLLADGLPGGQSLGKRFLKIAVVKEETGEPCSYSSSFVRNIAQILGFFDWVWIFGDRRRRAGDVLAHTKVIALR